MSILFESGERPVESVLHPTDLSAASLAAFHHALAIAIRYGARLTMLHPIGRRATDSWPDFPTVRDTVARWRAAGYTRALENKIKKSTINRVELDVRDPVAASLGQIRRYSADMIVVGTEGRAGLSRLLRAPSAEKLARESKIPTLFIPNGGRGFVAGETGEVLLKRILVPVAAATDPRAAMLLAVQSAALLDDPSIEVTLLHVGDGEETRVTDVPQLPFCQWNLMRRPGDIVEQILGVAEESQADAIYMSTAWQKGKLGRVEGSVTERVLASATCPLAAVPVPAG